MKYILFILIPVVIAGCSSEVKYKNDSDSESVVIGTFNIAWLGDRIDDKLNRDKEDYRAIADVINQTGCEVMAVQEIENIRAMELLLEYLPQYSAEIAVGSGDQHTGVLYKNTVSVEKIGNYSPIAVEPGKTRPGFVFKCRKGDFDWIMMSVHFKSTSRYDSTEALKEKSYELRRRQAEKAALWADSILNHTTERDVVIAGDFNDHPERERGNLDALLSGGELRFVTDELKSCKNPLYWDAIDHICVSRSAGARLMLESVYTFNIFDIFSEERAEKISDHCPVLAGFEIENE